MHSDLLSSSIETVRAVSVDNPAGRPVLGGAIMSSVPRIGTKRGVARIGRLICVSEQSALYSLRQASQGSRDTDVDL